MPMGWLLPQAEGLAHELPGSQSGTLRGRKPAQGQAACTEYGLGIPASGAAGTSFPLQPKAQAVHFPGRTPGTLALSTPNKSPVWTHLQFFVPRRRGSRQGPGGGIGI
jgi:hypothetical protein